MAKQTIDLKTIEIPFMRSPYNYDRDAASDESATRCMDPTMAQQSAKEESDINTIVKRFGLTGELPSGVRAPQYGDFTGITDYHSAMNAVAQANEAFNTMPADVRYRFHNNPREFVDFVSDDKNRAEAEKLGLVIPKAQEPVPLANVGTTAEVKPGDGIAPKGQGSATP